MSLVRLFSLTLAVPLLFSSPPSLPLSFLCLASEPGKPPEAVSAGPKTGSEEKTRSVSPHRPSDTTLQSGGANPRPPSAGTSEQPTVGVGGARARIPGLSLDFSGLGVSAPPLTKKKKKGPKLFTEETMGPWKKHPCLQQLDQAVQSIQAKGLAGKEAAKAFADAIIACGIRVVASDYDRTAISHHSGGSALPTDKHILQSLTRDFHWLGEELERRGIPLYFVTFSDRGENRDGRIAAGPLVEATLKASDAKFGARGVFGFFPPLYSDPDEYQALGLTGPMPMDKSFHVKQVSKVSGVPEEQILLLDDDVTNCVKYCKSGGIAVHVGGHDGFDFRHLHVVTKPALVMH
ncbi:unnamed protein product [Neospora caninum Liverpool]|uniref:p36 protein, putative n=1 Tax=Neospora caninum (strain Liverpool) TaxID=572307 RepID=F0VEA8_NEOCL|nr:uncharacterized protein NCLIV_018420 [Neospora caninum Liverpool]CBZ52052.1 unnamed protein product [Neospora caninum Liverpool]CEL66013.1 TPA: p36 protein, putative [Neospora caninum Liverpool]|eukprot:XP_003882084.1 uncharacterized protein NCLIV_018420 [Neospora caninum Liverpool]